MPTQRALIPSRGNRERAATSTTGCVASANSADVNSGSMASSIQNGVLTITIPVSQQARPRKIEISGGGGRGGAIDVGGSNT